MQDDLLVVGGSFAGLRCASVAAESGLRVRLVERKPTSGARVHTTGILVKEAAELLDVPARLVHRLEGVRLYSPALRTLDLVSPGYSFLATDTAAMLDWLAGQARCCGVRQSYATHIDSVETGAGEISLNRGQFHGRYLVGADGARSSIARLCNLEQNTRFLFGVEAGFRNIKGLDENLMHVFIDPQLAPGYIGWVLPGVGMTQIGLAARRPHKPQLDRFLTKLRGFIDMSRAKRLEYRAGLIPCGGTLRRTTKPGVMLLGDAAGTVSPLTAGGIYPALVTAEHAGIAIANYLQDAGPEPSAIVRQCLPKYRGKKLLRFGYDAMPQTAHVLEHLFSSRLFLMLAQTVFYHHRGLLSRAAWHDLWRVCSGRSN